MALARSPLECPPKSACSRVQDAYSLRCMPQVHGAVRQAIEHATAVFETELNAAVDNPLVFPAPKRPGSRGDQDGEGQIISGGNFHGEPLAFTLSLNTVDALR